MKTYLKKCPALVAVVQKFRLVRQEARAIQALRDLAHEHKKADIIVMTDRNSGLFSVYFQAIACMYMAIVLNKRAYFLFDKGPYFNRARCEPSWWDYYFDMSDSKYYSALASPSDSIIISSLQEQYQLSRLAAQLSRRQGYKICKQFKLKKDISAEISDFEKANFSQLFNVGLHYRGTDKVDGPYPESQRVDIAVIANLLLRISKIVGRFTLFVATDESAFIDQLRKLDIDFKMIHTDAIRSADGRSIHKSEHSDSDSGGPCMKGRQAIIDSYLLAKCDYLIRTDSNLSMASEFINPNLKSFNISKYEGATALGLKWVLLDIICAYLRKLIMASLRSCRSSVR